MEQGEETPDTQVVPPAGRRSGARTLAELRSRRNSFSTAADDPRFQDELHDDGADEWTRLPLEQHVMVHEAGHVVFALDHGIPFQDVLLRNGEAQTSPDDNQFEVRAELRFAGEDRATWAGRDPARGLRFALAGVYAEIEVLGEEYPEGGALDLRSWRDGVNLARGASPEHVDELLGRSQTAVLQEVDAWMRKTITIERVKHLAEHFANRLKDADSCEDLVVTYDEVVTALARA